MELLLVEDETNPESRAMVVKTNANVQYTKDSTGHEEASVKAESFRLVVYQLSGLNVCYISDDTLANYPTVILLRAFYNLYLCCCRFVPYPLSTHSTWSSSTSANHPAESHLKAYLFKSSPSTWTSKMWRFSSLLEITS